MPRKTVKSVLEAGCRRGVPSSDMAASFRGDAAVSGGVLKAGAPGAAIGDELRPQDGALIAAERGVDPRNGGHRHKVLRHKGVGAAVSMGVRTNEAVEAAARTGARHHDANHRGVVNAMLPTIGTPATASEVIAALG